MNPLKQKMTMKMKNMFWAALSMTAALVMTACSSDDNMTETPQTPSTSKKIPYTVTVGEATTRATVDGDNRTLRFATGDKLYITGTDIQGVLDITAGVGASTGAIFSGDLDYSGSGSPADGLSLTATLVSTQQTVGTQVSVDDAGAVTVNYPTTAYCSSINDAVQQYSWLTGTSPYGAKAFSLTQQTAFLNFEITVTGGTSGTTLPANVISGGKSIAKANVTTVTDGGVKAKFVLPVAAGTSLTSATVKLGGIEIGGTAIGSPTLSSGKVYNVKRPVDMSSVTLANTLNTADMAVKVNFNYSDVENYCLFASNGDGTYTFLSGAGWAGGNANCAKELVVKDDKLVFKQNHYNPITKYWDTDGYSVTFDTSTYSEWVGGDAKSIYNPSFISVKVNGTTISLTKALKITVDDLDKEEYQNWSEIVSNNSGKIYIDDDNYVRRCSDGAMLKQCNDGEYWYGVGSWDSYDPYWSYKFDGD